MEGGYSVAENNRWVSIFWRSSLPWERAGLEIGYWKTTPCGAFG